MSLAIPAALIFLLMLATMLVGMPIAVSMAAVGILGGFGAFGEPFIDSIEPFVDSIEAFVHRLLEVVEAFVGPALPGHHHRHDPTVILCL